MFANHRCGWPNQWFIKLSPMHRWNPQLTTIFDSASAKFPKREDISHQNTSRVECGPIKPTCFQCDAGINRCCECDPTQQNDEIKQPKCEKKNSWQIIFLSFIRLRCLVRIAKNSKCGVAAERIQMICLIWFGIAISHRNRNRLFHFGDVTLDRRNIILGWHQLGCVSSRSVATTIYSEIVNTLVEHRSFEIFGQWFGGGIDTHP